MKVDQIYHRVQEAQAETKDKVLHLQSLQLESLKASYQELFQVLNSEPEEAARIEELVAGKNSNMKIVKRYSHRDVTYALVEQGEEEAFWVRE